MSEDREVTRRMVEDDDGRAVDVNDEGDPVVDDDEPDPEE